MAARQIGQLERHNESEDKLQEPAHTYCRSPSCYVDFCHVTVNVFNRLMNLNLLAVDTLKRESQ